ncbi:MAG: cupin domain-containing protein [Betaproteobacteria bacterium]|nr:cupin domain-containing protein [Betaproteobacteria bacterium]
MKAKFQWRLTPDPSALSTAAVTKSCYADIPAYVTLDGSEIRELMHPAIHGNRRQSLAEATVAPGMKTQLHRHALTEELYHVTAGSGLMTLGEDCFKVGAGDTVLIAPGTPHRIEATGLEPLRFLCCCSPPYSHEDTELL